MNAPDLFALGGDDTELIEAERKIIELDAESRALIEGDQHHSAPVDADGCPLGWQALRDQIIDLDEMIATTPAATLAGAAVKLRRLLDPEIGMETGERETDLPCLRQILATIEREAPKP